MADGTAYHYTVHTDEETVGAALVALGLIDGEEGSYGLYVTTVLGSTLDYDTDGYWWALSENGTDASVGVDSLPVNDGKAPMPLLPPRPDFPETCRRNPGGRSSFLSQDSIFFSRTSKKGFTNKPASAIISELQ